MEKIHITRCLQKKAILKDYKNLPEEEKNKKESTEKIDITRCLKKKKQD